MRLLSLKEIKRIAHLARIHITEKELEKFSDMNPIIEMIGEVNAVDTEGLEPMFHPLHIAQRLREDVVIEINQRELLQSIAPNNIEAGLYLTPEVFE